MKTPSKTSTSGSSNKRKLTLIDQAIKDLQETRAKIYSQMLKDKIPSLEKMVGQCYKTSFGMYLKITGISEKGDYFLNETFFVDRDECRLELNYDVHLHNYDGKGHYESSKEYKRISPAQYEKAKMQALSRFLKKEKRPSK